MAGVAVAGVMGSCIGCMMVIEKLLKDDAGCMNLLTFSTFLFISIEGLLIGTNFLRQVRHIPLRGYIKLVVIFFTVNVVNNQALSFHVPVPLHIIFRSGSLLASLLLGKFILKRQYSARKYASVVIVTVGMVTCTLATGSQQQALSDSLSVEEARRHFFEWLIGVAMLLFALVASAYLGIVQERLFARYGQHPREALFYVHVMSLPAFVLMYSDIGKHAAIFSASAAVQIAGWSVPQLWLWLLAADIGQYGCIRCVYMLTAEYSALTVTLVVTLRKFASLLVSVVYFGNSFTAAHWLGTALVFSGGLLFADLRWPSAKHKKTQ